MGKVASRLWAGRTAAEADLNDERNLRFAYQEHGAELFRFALRQLRDSGAAQDVVQEVFLRAWRSAGRFDPEVASLRVWLFAIARNVVIDEIRRTTARPVRAIGFMADDINSVSPAASIDEQKLNTWLVEEALGKISSEHRSAIIETYLRGRPAAEVAVEQGIPAGTLRSRLYYGLKSLRVVMMEMGVENERQ